MTREGKHARELKDHYSFCIRDKNPSLVVMQGCPKALNQTCHQRHGITQQEQESCCAALPSRCSMDVFWKESTAASRKCHVFRCDIIRAELWHAVLMPALLSSSQCSFLSPSLFPSRIMREQPSPPLPSSPHHTGSRSPGALPCTCAGPQPCIFFFPKLLTTAQSLPAAFRGGLTLPSPRWRLLHGFEWDWVLQRVLFKGSLQLQAPVLYYCILSHFWQSSL